MNTVVLVGKVSDRPFRPGGGERVVQKINVTEESGRPEVFEFDAFGEIGNWVMSNLWIGDIISVRARLEERTYKDHGEDVDELRIVAVRVNLVARGPRQRPAPAAPNGAVARDPAVPKDPAATAPSDT